MAALTDTDLKELKDLINSRFEQLESRFTQLESQVEQLDKKIEIFQAQTEERFKAVDQRFENMERRFDDLKDEVKSQNNRFWTLVLALFVALFGAIAKIWFLPNP